MRRHTDLGLAVDERPIHDVAAAVERQLPGVEVEEPERRALEHRRAQDLVVRNGQPERGFERLEALDKSRVVDIVRLQHRHPQPLRRVHQRAVGRALPHDDAHHVVAPVREQAQRVGSPPAVTEHHQAQGAL